LNIRQLLVLLIVGASTTACGGSDILPDPQFENVVDTTTLYALSASDLGTSSGFDMFMARAVKPELGQVFDFVVDFDGSAAVLQPARVVGITLESGFVTVDRGFEEILEAPLTDYVSDSSLTLVSDEVFVMRSRINRETCGIFINLPHYGRFRVLTVDQAAGTVTFEHVVNRNCGYRDLNLGLPID
jgi:hypothetical protein